MAYEKEINDYIENHREEMIQDLESLIRINSERTEELEDMPYGKGPYEALKKGMEILEKYGFKVKNYGNRVITGDISENETKLDILAHLDVVPAGEDWTVTEPFTPLIKDGKMYGRGTCDDKGPAVAALYAIRAVKELGIPLKYNVRLILGSDEECGSSDIAYYYKHEKEAPMSFSPDATWPLINVEKGGIVNEFTQKFDKTNEDRSLVSLEGGIKINVVPRKAKMVLRGISYKEVSEVSNKLSEEIGVTFNLEENDNLLNVEVVGVNCHASMPELGKNAIQAALELLSRLELSKAPINEYAKAINKLFPYGDYNGRAMGVNLTDEISGATTVSLDIIHIDETSIRASYDCRASIIANDENTERVMEAKIRELGFEIKEKAMFPPHVVDADSELVKTLLKAYEKGFGVKNAKPIAIGGGTYVHNIKNGVAFGCEVPEVDNHMHGADEFVEIEMLIKSAKIFADAIVELCS